MSKIILKKYIKKVIINDEYASAEARGERLRKIRNLANLSRKDLCNTDELKLNTYKGWELARFGGLPLDGAERVVQRVAAEHVVCSVDWLLYGKGQEPYIAPQLNINLNSDQHELILKEILIFQSLYPNATYSTVDDDSLSPHYLCGDYVAGIKLYGEDIAAALNQVCIVELSDGRILVRYLRAGINKNDYQLLATNSNNSLENSQPLTAQLYCAAPVIRHYKISPFLNSPYSEPVTSPGHLK